jgi:hypothetical protein
MGCYESVEFQALDATLSKINPGFAGTHLHVDERAERDATPTFMRAIRWHAFRLIAGVIDGESLVDGACDLDADHWMDVASRRLEREGEPGGGRLERGVKRNARFFWLGSSVLGDVHRQAAVLVLLRLDSSVAWIEDPGAIPLCGAI